MSSATPAADCVAIFQRFAWDHGYYSPDIDITWAGFAGPGVARRGLVGPDPRHGPTSTAAGQNGLPTLTVPDASSGPWAEETDVRPTLLSLAGLRDDYLSDGTVPHTRRDDVCQAKRFCERRRRADVVFADNGPRSRGAIGGNRTRRVLRHRNA